MRFAPYWAKGSYQGQDAQGRQHTFTAWGWSFESLAEAQANGNTRAGNLFRRFVQGDLKRYPYARADQPLREEVIERITLDGKEIGVITRNAYGALVLNTASVLFADIDFPQGKAQDSGGGLVGAVMGLFGKPKPAPASPEQTQIEKIREWAAAHPDRAFRMYRTAAGLRLLFTDQLYNPTDPQTDQLLAALESDPLYRQLTKNQASFRARLTPKPWRFHFSNPPHEYPWQSQQAEQEAQMWVREYESLSRGYKTVDLIETFGARPTHPEIERIIDVHDRHAITNGSMLA